MAWSTGVEFLTPKQVADRLQLSEWTLSCWRSRGHGPKFRKVGRLVRYKSDDLEAWMDGTETKII